MTDTSWGDSRQLAPGSCYVTCRLTTPWTPQLGAAEVADAPKLVGTNLTALRNEMPKLPRHGRRMYHWHLEHIFGPCSLKGWKRFDWNDWITSKQKVFGQPFLLRNAGCMSRESWNRGVSLVLFVDDFCVLVALSWHPRACRDLQRFAEHLSIRQYRRLLTNNRRDQPSVLNIDDCDCSVIITRNRIWRFPESLGVPLTHL